MSLTSVVDNIISSFNTLVKPNSFGDLYYLLLKQNVIEIKNAVPIREPVRKPKKHVTIKKIEV